MENFAVPLQRNKDWKTIWDLQSYVSTSILIAKKDVIRERF